jgi:hypothetical protein
MTQEAQLLEIEVKKVRILFCTFVIATSSSSGLLKTHAVKKIRSEHDAKVAREKSTKWAGATPPFGLPFAQVVFRGRSRPLRLSHTACGKRERTEPTKVACTRY